MTRASSSTDCVTCERDAPMARNSASSRLRWATRIENVLTMRKVPTNSATAAKTSKKLLMKPKASWMRLAVLAASPSPVTASKPAGRAAATAVRRVSWEVPGAAVTHRFV